MPIPFASPTEAIMGRVNNEMTKWRVIYLTSRKNNKSERNLRNKRILREVRGRIGSKCAQGIFECDCHWRSWTCLRKGCKPLRTELHEYWVFVIFVSEGFAFRKEFIHPKVKRLIARLNNLEIKFKCFHSLTYHHLLSSQNVVYRDEINHKSNTIHTQLPICKNIYKYRPTLSFQTRTGLLTSDFGDTRREIPFFKVFAGHTMLSPPLRAEHLVTFKISVGRDPKNPTTSFNGQNPTLCLKY